MPTKSRKSARRARASHTAQRRVPAQDYHELEATAHETDQELLPSSAGQTQYISRIASWLKGVPTAATIAAQQARSGPRRPPPLNAPTSHRYNLRARRPKPGTMATIAPPRRSLKRAAPAQEPIRRQPRRAGSDGASLCDGSSPPSPPHGSSAAFQPSALHTPRPPSRMTPAGSATSVMTIVRASAMRRAEKDMHLRDTAPAVLHNPYTRVHCRAAGPPAHAARIMRRFAAAVIHGIGTIPWQLKATLQHPSASRPPEHFPDHLFAQDGGSDSAGAAAAAMLLQKACGIREQASMRNTSPSEDDWREVNPVVLAHADAGLVRQSTVSNDLVSRRFLPRLPGGGSPVPQCKVDLALGIIFDRLPDGVRVRSRSALAITDKDYFMFVPVETKSPYGSYGDGQYQATLFSAATLIAWDALRRSSPEIAAFDLPPVPAIVIVGYDWFLHWSYWDAEPDHGRITSLGPYHMGSTLTVQGTLKLLDIVRRLKAWAEAEWIVDDFDGTRDRGLWATLQHLLEVCEEAQPSKVENEA